MILFVPEHSVRLRSAIDRHSVTDHKARIDLASFDTLEERSHITHHVCLSGFYGETLVHGGPERNLVQQAAIAPGTETVPPLRRRGLPQPPWTVELTLSACFARSIMYSRECPDASTPTASMHESGPRLPVILRSSSITLSTC